MAKIEKKGQKEQVEGRESKKGRKSSWDNGEEESGRRRKMETEMRGD